MSTKRSLILASDCKIAFFGPIKHKNGQKCLKTDLTTPFPVNSATHSSTNKNIHRIAHFLPFFSIFTFLRFSHFFSCFPFSEIFSLLENHHSDFSIFKDKIRETSKTGLGSKRENFEFRDFLLTVLTSNEVTRIAFLHTFRVK